MQFKLAYSLVKKRWFMKSKYRDKYTILFFFCGYILFSISIFAEEKVLDASQIGKVPITLTEYFAVLEDPTQGLTLDDIQKPDIAKRFLIEGKTSSALSYGYSRSAYWLRFTLRNVSDQSIDRMLEISYAVLSSVQFHLPLIGGNYQSFTTGNALPFDTRPYPNHNFVFPVTMPAYSQSVYYLRIQSIKPTVIPAQLWEVKAFYAYERNDYISHALYFGMAMAMVIFNLLLFITLLDVTYLFYITFVTIGVVTLAAQYGLAQEFLWPKATLWSDISITSGYSITTAAMLIFQRSMLYTKKVIPWIDRLLKVIVAALLITPVGLAFNFQATIKPVIVLDVTAGIIILTIGFYCAFKRQRSAYFFVAAFTMLVFGAFALVLRNVGILPNNIFTSNGVQFASVFEMLILAFALADRYKVIQREKQKAHSDTLKAQAKALEAEQQLVENLRYSERMLEQKVNERTIALQAANLELTRLTTLDGLTKIANRRRFDEYLLIEWQGHLREQQPLALILIDIDFFKQYNDYYGHQGGDNCLIRVADAISQVTKRPTDLVARYGGEEFVAILSNTNMDGGVAIAELMLQAVASLAIPHKMSGVKSHITLSLGVAVLVPSRDTRLEDLIANADKALYMAKKRGRSRVEIFNSHFSD